MKQISVALTGRKKEHMALSCPCDLKHATVMGAIVVSLSVNKKSILDTGCLWLIDY